MTPELAICERMAATAAVIAIVPSARIYDVNLPQEPVVPAILAQVVADPRSYHNRGPVGLDPALIQVDLYIAERATVVIPDPGTLLTTLADAVDDCLNGKTFTVGNRKVTGVFQRNRTKPRPEPGDRRLLRVMLEYTVWSKLV